MTSLNANDSQSLSFCKGLKLLESGCVENVLQVGKFEDEEGVFNGPWGSLCAATEGVSYFMDCAN